MCLLLQMLVLLVLLLLFLLQVERVELVGVECSASGAACRRLTWLVAERRLVSNLLRALQMVLVMLLLVLLLLVLLVMSASVRRVIGEGGYELVLLGGGRGNQMRIQAGEVGCWRKLMRLIVACLQRGYSVAATFLVGLAGASVGADKACCCARLLLLLAGCGASSARLRRRRRR